MPRFGLRKRIYAFIPARIRPGTVLAAFELMRRLQRLFGRDYSRRNLPRNRDSFIKHAAALERAGNYIEDQHSWADTAYGGVTLSYSGCEVIAVYNAVLSLTGRAPDLPELIGEFERDGMILGGRFGTSPASLEEYCRRKGFGTVSSTDTAEFDSLAERSRTLVLTIYNDGMDIRRQVHTVSITRGPDGYTAHNVYCDGRTEGPYSTVGELIRGINGGRAKPIILYGIS